ncbi:MAG: hypothetical protein B6226_01985 [Candidatus Cloacimonetes bacterium 4572_65]|nr:MAG: hypothetical protein B6226_01985 [Candidatus Cloacimonetes bacterium 4572_65]
MSSEVFAIEDISGLIEKAHNILEITPELSLKYALLVEDRFSESDKERYSGIINRIIGDCYLRLEEPALAHKYVQKAYSFYESHNNIIEQVRINSLIAKIYLKEKNIDKAVEIYNEMIISSNLIGYSMGVITAINDMAFMYIEQGDFSIALEMLKSISNEELDQINKSLRMEILINFAYSAIRSNNLEGIEKLLKSTLTMAYEIGDKKPVKLCYRNFYQYNKVINNLPESYRYLELSYNISETIMKQDSHNQIAQILSQFEMDKKEQEISLIQEKNRKLEEANATIRKQKLFVETILDTIPSPIYYKDLNGKYLGFNRSWKEVFNKGLSSKQGKTVFDLFTKESADSFQLNDKELLKKKRLIRYESKMLLSDKKTHDMVFHKDVFRDEKGSIAGIIGVINDVTDLKKTTFELAKTNSYLEALFNSAPVGVCIFDINGTLSFANKYLGELFGFVGDEKGHSIFEFILEEDVDDVKSILKQNLGNSEKAPLDRRIKTWSGTILYAKISYTAVINPETKEVAIIGVVTDTTGKKIYEEALKRSERKLKEAISTKDRFFSIIAHDLRGPIGNFREIFRLLATNHNNFSDKERQSLMKELYKSADNTFDLLENLLNWSRSQSNELKHNPNFISLFDITSKTIKVIKAMTDAKKLTIINKIEVQQIGYFDKNMISTVIRNLLTNAIKFSYSGSEIVISSKRGEKYIEISIEDSGVGLTAETIDTIFNNSNISTLPGTNNEKGTGLGLILCKLFVEMNHGDIWVESIYGEGSTFKFNVPTDKLDNYSGI